MRLPTAPSQSHPSRTRGRLGPNAGALVLAGGLAACLAPEVLADTYVNGNQTWATGTVTLNDNYIIQGTLTVEPGVVVRVAPGFWIRVDAGGTLLVNGTKDAPVQFVADQDKRWNGLQFNKDSTGRVTHAHIADINNTGLAIDGASPRIEWTTIRTVVGSATGFSAVAIDLTGGAAPVITNCTIDGVTGAPGSIGLNGSGGGAGSTGTSATPGGRGGDGSAGDRGKQGGNGGAAYGVRVQSASLPAFTNNRISNVRGGPGGRGGAGGNAGAGGRGGQGLFAVISGNGGNGGWGGAAGNGGIGGYGGNAFGVYMDVPGQNAALIQNLIVSIQGGAGGGGWVGGVGGVGGQGGNGSNNGIPFAKAGNGGNGGNGGPGGHGGAGGRGGYAWGLEVQSSQTPVIVRQNTVALVQFGPAGSQYASGSAGGTAGSGGNGGANALGYAGSGGSSGSAGGYGSPGAIGYPGGVYGLFTYAPTATNAVQIDARNNIIALDGGTESTALYGAGSGVILSDYNLISGYTTLSYGAVVRGENDILADPLFAGPGDGDFRPAAPSPAIDAGDNLSVHAGLAFDLAGLPRLIDIPSVVNATPMSTVDIGAYEFALPIRITQQPMSLSVDVGRPALLSVQAEGTGPLSYQWFLNGAKLSKSARVTGVNSPALSISPTGVIDSGTYSVQVSSVAGTVTSAQATLTVKPVFGTASGERIRGSATKRGTRTVTYTSADQRPMLLQKENDSRPWYLSALDEAVQLQPQSGDVLTWTGAATDDPFVAILGTEATVVLNTAHADGFDPNITGRIPGATPIVHSGTVFTSTAGMTHLAGMNPSGELVMYFQTGFHAPNDWAYTNLSRDHLKPQGIETPAFQGELVSYVTSWNGLNIAGLDKSGQIHAVWWAPGMARWRADNISTLTGAPTLVGSLTAYVTPWGGINLTATDGQGDLTTTWWVPGNPWLTSNLTDLVGGPSLVTDSLSSYVTPWGGLNVAGTAPDGSVQIYWWAPGMTEWVVSPISALIPGADMPAGKMTGVAAPTGEINLLGSNVQGEVFRYHWHPSADWASENISRSALRK